MGSDEGIVSRGKGEPKQCPIQMARLNHFEALEPRHARALRRMRTLAILVLCMRRCQHDGLAWYTQTHTPTLLYSMPKSGQLLLPSLHP